MLSPGKIIDGYEFLRRIGRGGFGEVWLVKLGATSEFRALKWIPASTAEYLQKELEAVKIYRSKLARLGCRSLLPIEHLGRDESGFYYVLPLADALAGGNPADEDWVPKTLANLIESRRQARTWFSSREIVEMFLPIVEAADALSRAGLLHRDIKPANIIFHDGMPCLCDVGLVGLDTPTLSHLGTPGFSAPSWYLETGGNPDLWGLACTLFTLLSGHNPDKLGRGNYLWPPQEGLSPEERLRWMAIHKLIHRATSAKASERFLRIGDFGDALGGSLQRVPRVKRRLLYSLVLGCVIVAGGAAIWSSIAKRVDGNFQREKMVVAPETTPAQGRQSQHQETPPVQIRAVDAERSGPQDSNGTPSAVSPEGAPDNAATAVLRQKVAEFDAMKNTIISGSFKELEEAAGRGDTKAMVRLGFLYGKGEGVPRDRDRAHQWYRNAWLLGEPESTDGMSAFSKFPVSMLTPEAKRLREIFFADEIGKKKFTSADVVNAHSIAELEQLAGQGNAQAMLILGIFYAKGEAVPKDRYEALKWFQKATVAGHSMGMAAMEALECPEETLSPRAKRMREMFNEPPQIKTPDN